jgi:hypothetical protein
MPAGAILREFWSDNGNHIEAELASQPAHWTARGLGAKPHQSLLQFMWLLVNISSIPLPVSLRPEASTGP